MLLLTLLLLRLILPILLLYIRGRRFGGSCCLQSGMLHFRWLG